jgi:hypothetical protein
VQPHERSARYRSRGVPLNYNLVRNQSRSRVPRSHEDPVSPVVRNRLMQDLRAKDP